jgi:chromosome segregation ATPase
MIRSTAFSPGVPNSAVLATPSQPRRRLSLRGTGEQGLQSSNRRPRPAGGLFGDGREPPPAPPRSASSPRTATTPRSPPRPSPPRQANGVGSPSSLSGEREMTVKESENRVQELERSEFDLKMRIFFLEERLAACSDGGDGGPHNEIINLKQRLEALEVEASRAVAECEQWRDREARAQAELKSSKAELAALRGEIHSVEVTVSESYATRVSLLETELRQAKRELEAARQDAKEEVAALQAELRREHDWGAAEAAALEREYVKTGGKQHLNMEMLQLNVEKLKMELETAGTELLKKDLTIRSLRQVLEQKKILESGMKASEMEVHHLSAEISVLQGHLAGARRAIDAKSAEVVRERRRAEEVAMLEAEEIAKLREELLKFDAALQEQHDARIAAESKLAPTEAALVEAERILHESRRQFADERGVYESERRRLLGQAASSAGQIERLRSQLQQLMNERSHMLRTGQISSSPRDGSPHASSSNREDDSAFSAGTATPRTQVWSATPNFQLRDLQSDETPPSGPMAMLRQRIAGSAAAPYSPRSSSSAIHQPLSPARSCRSEFGSEYRAAIEEELAETRRKVSEGLFQPTDN